MKKYEFTEKEYFTQGKGDSSNVKFKQIRALRDFSDVTKGDIGGWIESGYNLSHKGTCWVYPEGMVWGDGRVEDQAMLECGNVYERAMLCGDAIVRGGAEISGMAIIEGNLIIDGGKITSQ